MEARAAAGPVMRRRWRYIVPAALLVLVALGLFVLRDEIARWIVEREARAAGFEVELGAARAGWGTVALRDVRFTFVGAPQIRGRADRVIVQLSGLAPERLDLGDAALEIEGPPGPVIRDLIAWASTHDAARALRVEASAVRVRWAGAGAAAADPGWITIAGSARWTGERGVLRATQVIVAGRDLGAVPVSWSVDAGGLTVGVDGEDPASARLRVKAHAPQAAGAPGGGTGEAGVQVEATLQPLPLGRLLQAGLVSSSRAGKDVVIDGSARLILPMAPEPRPIEGAASVNLVGYVPPHPVELDGILFGDRTVVTTRFTIDRDRNGVQLADVSVSAGALKLSGQGTVLRAAAARGAPDHATLDLRLSGAVACSILTRSAVSAHLGKAGGDFFGDLAQRALTGSVAVTVLVAADSRDMAAARITPSARVGCRLRLL